MTDIVNRLRAEDPECGLRLSIAAEAADRIEELEGVLRQIAEKRCNPCDKYCGHFLDVQSIASAALKGTQ
jgi:hypothetical protein